MNQKFIRAVAIAMIVLMILSTVTVFIGASIL